MSDESQTNTEDTNHDQVDSQVEASQTEIREDASEQVETSEETNEIDSPEYELSRSEESVLSEDQFGEIVEFTKKHGLSEDAANEVIQREEALIGGIAEKIRADHEAMIDGWIEKSKSDPAIGGDNLPKTAELSKRALEQFGSDELREALLETGYGNHPEVIRMLSQIGQLLEDDKLITGGVSSEPKTAAQLLYGN